MKYAPEIIDALYSDIHKYWKLQDLVKLVLPIAATKREISATRKQVLRIVLTLKENGSIICRPGKISRGGYYLYRIK